MKITRLGHSMFRFDTAEGTVLLIDPWFDGNPTCPEEYKSPGKLKEIDAILLTHGNCHHTAGVKGIQDANPHAIVFGQYEWMRDEGGVRNPSFLNIGGTVNFRGIKVTMVSASHTSVYQEEAGKVPCSGAGVGYVITCEDGFKIYISGNTGLSADMTIIRDYYQPDLVILSVAGILTIDPDAACYASNTLLHAKHVVPSHDYPEPSAAPNPEDMKRLLEDLPFVHQLLNRSQKFERLMKERHPHIKVSVLGFGECLDLTEIRAIR